MKHTEQQIAIVDFVHKGKGHLLIDALAGTGKTSTLLDSLRSAPQRSALMCAFNKAIAEELTERMGKAPPGFMWKAATFHSCGLKIIQSHRPRIEVRSEATEDLVNEAALAMEASTIAKDGKPFRVAFAIRRAAVKLLRTMKDTCTERKPSLTAIRVTGEMYDAFGKVGGDDAKQVACELVASAYELSLDLASRLSIDFCDMTWLPVVLDLSPPSRYQIVYVDEAQDLSTPQLQLVKKLVAPNGRLVVVGDLNQSVYRWRGAVGEAVWEEMLTTYQAAKLPLTTTFRCAKVIVKEANAIVPTLRPRDGAPDGKVAGCNFEELPKILKDSWQTETFILSRNNSDLLHTALYLWRSDVGFKLLAGREIIEPLYEIIDKLNTTTKQAFSNGLVSWHQNEMNKAEAAHATAWADRIEQQYESLMMMLSYAEPRSFRQILQDMLVSSSTSNTQLSTVHKVKGLEAERVFLLKQTFARYRYQQELEEAVDDWQRNRAMDRLANIDREEENLLYVAITRAKNHLTYVDMRGATTSVLARLQAQKSES